ncbi:hypothetical protein ACPPVT_17450 [Angustibacter sp. McL0619]|uniref:hypothetical protein n=1 Tax=Angustibacter sp. McL0619 TaxID=3415676 RepID=UPI003CE9F153
MKPLDQVVRDRVAPVLKDAGFKRKGRAFWLASPSGDYAVVAVSAFKLAVHDAEFFVDFAVTPKAYLDFVNRNGDAQGAPGGLWTDRLQVPGKQTIAMRDHWSFDLDDDATGEQLTTLLRQVVPSLIRLLDRRNLLAYVREPSTRMQEIWIRPREAAVALLLADDGPSAELEQLVGGLAQDDRHAELVAFIRRRVVESSIG